MTEDLELQSEEVAPRPGSRRSGKETKAELAAKRKVDREYQRERREKINEAGITDVLREDWRLVGNEAEQCFIGGKQNAEYTRATASRSYWSKPRSPYITDELGGRSEVLPHRVLFALYHFCASALEILGAKISYEEWLNLRDRARKDLFWLATTILGIPLISEVHGQFIDAVYPKLNCDGMFLRDYTLVDVHKAIGAQTEVKESLGLFPRGEMKTAMNSAFATQFFLNFPDGRIFDISGTDDLALGFLRIMRGYFGRDDNVPPSDLHLLFPEYVLHGASELTSEKPIVLPCRKHAQKDRSYASFGVSGAISGAHADLVFADDTVQEPGNETSRAKLRARINTIMLNVPDIWAIKVYTGTRYHEEDYYSHQVAMHEENPDAMRFICKGVFEVKPGLEDVPIQDLTLDQVVLLNPNKAGSPEKTFASYKHDMRIDLGDFMHQKLNRPVSVTDEDKVAFDYDVLNNHFVDFNQLPRTGDRYLVVDVAFSKAITADYSVLITGRIAGMDSSELQSALIEDIDAGKRSNSELALSILIASMKWQPKTVVIEKVNGVDALITEVRRLADQRGYVLPFIYAAPIITAPRAKWNRIKNLDILTMQNRLWFSQSISTPMKVMMLDQFTKYSGKRGSTRKDDIPDAISLLVEWCLPKTAKDAKNEEERRKAEELAAQKAMLESEYRRIFGDRLDAPRAMPAVDEGKDISDRRGIFGIPGLGTGPSELNHQVTTAKWPNTVFWK